MSTPEPGSGLEEYRQLTAEAAAAVLGGLRWLELVNAQTHRCPPRIAAGFGEEVEHLQVESIRVRARAQAIQARGDAYFESWTGNTDLQSGTPAGRSSESSPELRESFTRIKLASRQAREAFGPFFSGLHRLQAGLEANPTVIETNATKQLVRTTREHGWEVLRRLGVLRDELEALRPVLARMRPANL